MRTGGLCAAAIRFRLLVVIGAVALLASGCATLHRWEAVQVGMEPDQVKALLGAPRQLDAGDQGQGLQGSWVYVNLIGTRRFEIIFDKGKVAEKHVRSLRAW
jgi:hypothetical protein